MRTVSERVPAELCFRFQGRGWDVIYEPRAVAEHRRRVVPAGRAALPAFINYHSLKNRYLLRAYHQTTGNAVRTLLPTLACFYFYGYTLNRITLAAMIFAIGILVDDAIVVVENVHRHLSLPGGINGASARGTELAIATYMLNVVSGGGTLFTSGGYRGPIHSFGCIFING